MTQIVMENRPRADIDFARLEDSWWMEAADVSGTARLLIKAGADVNAKAKGGGTPLMMADALQCEGLAKMLRDAGAAEWQ